MTSTIVDDHTSNLTDFGGSEELWDDDVAHEEVIGEEVGNHYIEVGGVDVEQNYVEEVDEGIDDSGAYHNSLLQMKNGRPVFTLNLPDLLSQPKTLPTGEIFYICFSKKCTRQLALDGYIYNITGMSEENNNIWRCANTGCTGTIKTSPNLESLRIRNEHAHGCVADDKQVRLRISIYDLRLMAEFTDVDFHALYNAYVDKVRTEQSDIGHLFPSFETIKDRLERHRSQYIFRRHFEIRKQLSLRRKLFMSQQQPRVDPTVQFRRTKAFPPSICVECNMEILSNDIAPSHDLLIDHLDYQHQRQLQVERYTFPEAALFEQWIRELQQHSRYRLRKLGLYDEHMYYLCHSDDRQQRCNHGKGTIINLQCSAFVRVHDWRYILRREIKPVVVDYCLDHIFHSGDSPLPDTCRQPLYEYYSPEVFMKDLEARRQRTQILLKTTNSLQRIKRVMQPKVIDPPQLATVPVHGPAHSDRSRYLYKPTGSEMGSGSNAQAVDESDGSEQWIIEPVDDHGKLSTNMADPCCSLPSPSKLSKSGYEEKGTCELVNQIELQCDLLKQRVQHCRRADVAKKYLTRISSLLDDVMADPLCAPRGNEPDKHSYMRPPSTSKMNDVSMDGSDKTKHTLKLAPISVTKARHSVNSNADGNIRQAMFLRRGENGEMVIVRRTMKKFRKVVHVADEPVSSYSNYDPLPKTDDPLDIKNIPDDLVQAEGLSPTNNTKNLEPSSSDELIDVQDHKPQNEDELSHNDKNLETKDAMQSPSPPKRSRGRPRKVYSPS